MAWEWSSAPPPRWVPAHRGGGAVRTASAGHPQGPREDGQTPDLSRLLAGAVSPGGSGSQPPALGWAAGEGARWQVLCSGILFPAREHAVGLHTPHARETAKCPRRLSQPEVAGLPTPPVIAFAPHGAPGPPPGPQTGPARTPRGPPEAVQARALPVEVTVPVLEPGPKPASKQLAPSAGSGVSGPTPGPFSLLPEGKGGWCGCRQGFVLLGRGGRCSSALPRRTASSWVRGRHSGQDTGFTVPSSGVPTCQLCDFGQVIQPLSAPLSPV